MPSKNSPNLSRFKKGMQGLIEFATLIEQSDPAHRTMILRAAETEDPRFLANAMKKVVFFEEFIYLDQAILAEILSKVSPKVLAFGIHGVTPEVREGIIGQLGHREKKLVQDEEAGMRSTADAFVLGARRQILKIARSLEAQGKFVFELTDCPRFQKKSKTADEG